MLENRLEEVHGDVMGSLQKAMADQDYVVSSYSLERPGGDAITIELKSPRGWREELVTFLPMPKGVVWEHLARQHDLITQLVDEAFEHNGLVKQASDDAVIGGLR